MCCTMAGLQQDNNCQYKQVHLLQAHQGLRCCLSSLPYENEYLARDRICNFKLHVVQLRYVAFAAAITRGGCRGHSASKVSHTYHKSWDLLDRPQKYSLRQKGNPTISRTKTQSLKSSFLLDCPLWHQAFKSSAIIHISTSKKVVIRNNSTRSVLTDKHGKSW